MVKRTLKAFSLAEMILAMVIIMIAAVAAMPIMTQQKPNIPQTNLRGQYACWKYGPKYYQQHCEERSCEIAQEVDSCKFVLDSRPAHFFIAAVGANTTDKDEQVVLVDNPTIADDLKITIDDKQTIVTPGDSTTPIIAVSSSNIGGNGLYISNIEKCRLLSAGKTCASGKQTGCKVTYDYNVGEAKIEILGCTQYDASGNPTNGSLYSISSFEEDGDSYYVPGTDVKVNFKLRDSMHSAMTSGKGTFLKILESIPTTRKSVMIDGFIKNNPHDIYDYSNGAVLILW